MDSVPRLTCERCKKRKIKCDKRTPCTGCESAGVPCEAVRRARLPRGKSGRVQKGTLEHRVARIESLLKQAQGSSNSEVGAVSNGVNGSAALTESVVASSKDGEFLAPDFWNALAQEVSGLRETFDSSDEEDASPSASDTARPFKPVASETATLFGAKILEASSDGPFPSVRVRSILLDVYKQRVDCVYKLLHWPTVRRDIELAHVDTTAALQTASARALELAICFMALCSISDEEATEFGLGDRLKQLQQYQVATEASISEANLLWNPNVTVLQAFVIYLIGLRSHQNCATQWTLLATAVRVATALRLGQEVPSRLSPFDLELRRRLWYCICLMDTHASLDRGTISMIRYDEVGPAPLCLDDKDMSPTFVPESSSSGFNDSSFSEMSYKAMLCHKKMLAMPGATEEQWKLKLNLIQDFETSMRHAYCNIGSTPTLVERLASFSTMEIIASMHLLLRRPTHKQQREAIPAWDEFDVMEVATTILERHLQVRTAEFDIWRWKSWVQWHALAVVLAELLSRPKTPYTDRVYSVASRCFDGYAQVVADSESGMLWRPIIKLMRRVRKLRVPALPTPESTLSDGLSGTSISPASAPVPGSDCNTCGLEAHAHVPESYQYEILPWALDWSANNASEDTFMIGGDVPLGAFDDPQLNWDMFLDDMNFNYSMDYTNTAF